VVCLACDPKTAGTSYTIAEKDSDAEEDNSGSDEDDTNQEEEKEQSNSNNNNTQQKGALKCSYRKCGKSYFNDDVWALLHWN
jgi:hypothetical protein